MYSRNPKNWGYDKLIEAAQAYRLQGRLDDSLKLLTLAKDKYANTFRESHILFAIADLEAQKGLTQDAEKLFEKIIAEYPDNEDDMFNSEMGLADLYIKQGDLDKALVRLQKVVKDWEFFHQINQAYQKISEIYSKQGKPEQAEATLSTFVQKYKDDKKFSLEGLKLLAEYKRKSNPAEALAIYERIAKEFADDQGSLWAQVDMADLKLDMGKADEAFAAFKRIYDDPKNPKEIRSSALNRMALVKDIQRQPEEALALYKRIISEFPEAGPSTGAMNSIANLYMNIE